MCCKTPRVSEIICFRYHQYSFQGNVYIFISKDPNKVMNYNEYHAYYLYDKSLIN